MRPGSAISWLRRGLSLAAAAAAVGALAWWTWNPGAATEQRFDRGHNGLWVGHQWYTGRTVRGGEPVSEAELEAFVHTLIEQRIRYAFVHVGPILKDGTARDLASPFFTALRRRTPEVRYLAWIGGIAARLPLEEPGWQEQVVRTVERFVEEGFSGVHLNIEPLESHHEGYLELLHALRSRLPRSFLLSHATRQAGPFGIAIGPLEPRMWSEEFYRATMQLTDQTVLMAYDTKMDVRKHYVGFVKHQTGLLVAWGCQVPGHKVLIGIPSYEDVPLYSNPEVENIENAALGVRAALEEATSDADCFEGVSVYANWVTDGEEWDQYRRVWLESDSAFH